MTTVENFMSELRRMLVTTSTKSESLRAAAIAEPTSTNSGFGARYAIEFSEEIQNRSDLLRSQTSKMAALCSTAPDMGAMAKALEQALLYNDHLIDLLEERASEYGYEVPCRPSPSKVPLDGPITPGVLHGQSRNATPLPKSLSTPKRSVKKIPEMEDLPPRTPTLADFGISYDEVENLVCNPPLTTPHHGVTRVSEQQDHSSVMEADDPEYEPPQSCEDVEHDETSTLSTPRQVKTALCFHESKSHRANNTSLLRAPPLTNMLLSSQVMEKISFLMSATIDLFRALRDHELL